MKIRLAILAACASAFALAQMSPVEASFTTAVEVEGQAASAQAAVDRPIRLAAPVVTSRSNKKAGVAKTADDKTGPATAPVNTSRSNKKR